MMKRAIRCILPVGVGVGVICFPVARADDDDTAAIHALLKGGIQQAELGEDIEEFRKTLNNGHDPVAFDVPPVQVEPAEPIEAECTTPEEVKALARRGNAGDVEAKFAMGLFFCKGHVVPQNPKAAGPWFLSAANLGHAKAQYYLGRCYDTGFGTERNTQAAGLWYLNAANKGYAPAKFRLARHYVETGQGTAEHIAGLYQEAALAGHAEAQYELGLRYRSGDGVPKHRGQAIRLFRSAAEGGSAAARFELASSYATGSPWLARDVVEAYAWMLLAQESGYDATEALEGLARRLTADELNRAVELARAHGSRFPAVSAPNRLW